MASHPSGSRPIARGSTCNNERACSNSLSGCSDVISPDISSQLMDFEWAEENEGTVTQPSSVLGDPYLDEESPADECSTHATKTAPLQGYKAAHHPAPSSHVDTAKHMDTSGVPNISLGKAEDAWRIVETTIEQYDNKLVTGWKEELASVLVFAGLFSAVVTAFNVEAYTWLKEDPQDKTTLLLQDIRHHFLASAAHNSAYTPPTISQDVLFKAKTVDVAINVLWFLSLTFALIAALFATLVQQWLKHYSDLPQADAKHRASLRQTRFEALDRWNVPQIIIALGVLLQVALFLFLGGLLCLLWSINTPVAFSVTTAVAICALVCLFTAAAPTFSTTCPYKSPAAWAFRFLACHAPLLGFFSRILRCGIEAISQQFQLTFSGRLQANLKKCLLQMDALLLRLEDPSSIINYGAWLDAEVTALKNMDDFRVMYRIINWTVFTNRCHTIKDLLACFLNDTESFGAKHALSRWFAADSSMSTGEVDGLIKSKSADHYSILINESNLSVVKVLIPLACQQYIRADVFFWRTASVDWMHLALWTLAPARARMHNSDGWPDVVWTFFEQLSEPLKYADRITEFLALANGVIEETHDRRFLGGAFAYDCLGAIADFGWILNLQDATLLAVPQHTSRRSEVTQSTQAHDRVLSDHLNRAFELAALAALELIARTDTSETHLRYTRQETVETIVSYFERAKIQEELAPRSRTSETHGLVLGIRLWSKTLGSLNRQAHCQEEAAEITEAYWSLVERGELSALVDTMFSITTDWKVLHGSG